MKMKVLAFGIAKDIFGGPSLELHLADGTSVAALKATLQQQYPRLQQLSSFMIAVNNEYAAMDYIINSTDEIALIPPVSGG